MRPETPLAVENGVGKLAAKARLMPAREREHGELPTPNLSLPDRKTRQGLFVFAGDYISSIEGGARLFRIMFKYLRGNDLDLDEVIDLYRASTLGERRPIDDRARFAGMLQNANLVITAWDGELMVGISRSLSDFHYVTYLADLAVRESHQRRGIGKELIRRTRIESGPRTSLVLLAAPAAVNYYPHIGFTQMPQTWFIKEGSQIEGLS
jgi:ribosomal protein S18 acetylase RimI-like enzyme